MVDDEVQDQDTCKDGKVHPEWEGLVDTTGNIRNKSRLISHIHDPFGQWNRNQCSYRYDIEITIQIHLLHFLIPVSEDLNQSNVEGRTIDHNLHHQIHNNNEDQNRYSSDRKDHSLHYIREDTGSLLHIGLCRCCI